MSFMWCTDCEEFFAEDEGGTTKEYHNEIDGDFYEEFITCPCCGSTDIEEAHTCEVCGEPTRETSICDNCKMEFLADLNEFFKAESARLNGFDINYLKEIACDSF